MRTRIGKCSLCGGDVVLPQVWHGVDPPRPQCSNCFATQSDNVIPMERPKWQRAHIGETHRGPPRC